MRSQYLYVHLEEQISLQGTVKRWVMNVCTGFIWLMKEMDFVNMGNKFHLLHQETKLSDISK
jgi:hypothetical protein